MSSNNKNNKNDCHNKFFDLPELPDAPDFISTTPVYTLPEMIKLSEKMLSYWNKIRYSKPEPEFIGDAFEF